MYEYDGLGRRTVHTRSVLGETEHEFYTHAWQRVEVRPNGETSEVGASLFVYGLRYIDDIALRVRDANETGTPEDRRYYLTDANYNVVMTVDDAGRGSERIFYRAYGEPECFSFGDVHGDYDVDNDDDTALATIIDNSGQPYNVLADLNLDGKVDQADANIHQNYLGRTGGANVLSVDEEANDVGYAGYLWNDERAQWHVRHRELSPKLGRWLQRDPLALAKLVGTPLVYRFADTPTTSRISAAEQLFTRTNQVQLYEYVSGGPLGLLDPSGLIRVCCRGIRDAGSGERAFKHCELADKCRGDEEAYDVW